MLKRRFRGMRTFLNCVAARWLLVPSRVPTQLCARNDKVVELLVEKRVYYFSQRTRSYPELNSIRVGREFAVERSP